MSLQKDTIRSRIDPAVKAQAQNILQSMGLSMSDALRLFLYQVVAERRLPFDVKVPRAETLHALQDSVEESVSITTLDKLSQVWINEQNN